MMRSSGQWLPLVESREFSALWRAVTKRYVRWSDFQNLEMPNGLSPEEAWKITRELLKNAGTTLGHPAWFANHHGESMWYYTTRVMDQLVSEIKQMTADSSELGQQFAKFGSLRFCYALNASEIASTLADDGYGLPNESLKKIFLHHQKPENDHEQAAENLSQLFTELPLYVGRPIDRELIDELYHRLSSGVTVREAPSSLPREPNWNIFTPDYVLDRICAFANGVASEDYVDPVFVGMEMRRYFVDYRPLPSLNATLNLVLRNKYYSDIGYAALGLLDISVVERNADYATLIELAERPQNNATGTDTTLYHELMAFSYRQNIETLETKVRKFVEQRKRHKDTVNNLPFLNARQKDIVLLFLKDPETTLSVSDYRQRHAVAYSTAHEDLTNMVKLGYLKVSREGHAYRYEPGPKLLELA